MTIFAQAGEWITCENMMGEHRIARTARTIQQGERFSESLLTDWQQPSGSHQCARCGKAWWRSGGGIHFENGSWRY